MSKSVTKELSTFLSWGKESIIGYNTEKKNDKTIVTEVWCKLCAKFKNQIQRDPSIKGAVKSSVKAFTEGTNIVTKHQVRKMFLWD